MKLGLKNKNILITGANGFIGSHLAQILMRYKANVICVDKDFKNKNTYFFIENLHLHCKYFNFSLNQKVKLNNIFKKYNITHIFHLAAQPEVMQAYDSPYETFENNVRATYSLLDVCNKYSNKIKSIVVASSDKAYGEYSISKLPYKESYPLKAIHPYDVSKVCTDYISLSYAKSLKKLPIIVTRFCNIYGPGQKNLSCIVPNSIFHCMSKMNLTLRSDGKFIRDYIYIDDVIKLYVEISRALSLNHKLSGEVFNYGTNNPTTVKEILEIIFAYFEKTNDLKKIIKSAKNNKIKGEIKHQYMDFKKVKKYFNCSPTINLKNGLRKTISWYLKNYK